MQAFHLSEEMFSLALAFFLNGHMTAPCIAKMMYWSSVMMNVRGKGVLFKVEKAEWWLKVRTGNTFLISAELLITFLAVFNKLSIETLISVATTIQINQYV